MRATPEASSGQVPEAGSGQALQFRGLKVKNEVGALATSIIYILLHNPGLYQNMQILSEFIGRFPASMHIRMPRVEWFVF